MRNKMQRRVTLWLVAVMIVVAGPAAWSQQVDKHAHPDLAIEYDYVHSNAPPGGCSCINLSGASSTFAWPIFRKGLSVVGRVNGTAAAVHTKTLYLSTYTGGVRYEPHFAFHSMHPFAQLTVGAAHASGTFFDGQSSDNSGTAFASDLGGGLDVRLNPRFSVRLIDASYLATTFANGVNDHQNNFRISTGVVFHF